MPSMRRASRIFEMVTTYDGARVLRSGRRLWPEKTVEEANELYELFKNNNKIQKPNKNEANKKPDNNSSVREIKTFKRKTWRLKPHEEPKPNTAKRARVEETNAKETIKTVKRKICEDETENSLVASKRFGIVYTRRVKRIKGQRSELGVGIKPIVSLPSQLSDRAFAVVVDLNGFSGFSLFLYTILRYMTRRRLKLDKLAGFLLWQPINGAYALLGLQFSWDPCPRTGLFKFYGAQCYVPLFSLDFSAAPRCFLYMHRFLLLRLGFQQLVFVNKFSAVRATDEIMSESEANDECVMYEPSESVLPGSVVIALTAPEVDSANRPLMNPCVKSSKPVTRSSSRYRNGPNSRTIQKRKSTRKSSRRPTTPSPVAIRKAKTASVPDLSNMRNVYPFLSIVPKYKLRSSVKRPSALKKARSIVVGLSTTNENSSSCNVNILVIESDKCYREEGASVVLEKSPLGKWFLVVEKDGITRYTHKPENNMRPPVSNRVTHALMWTVDDSLKLEFLNRQDWLVFKDLYKECDDHNVLVPDVSAIPVPVVREVSGFDDVISVPFHRPQHSYISTNGDEVFRALEKRTANYNADAEDEEWLKKLSNDFLIGHEHVSIDRFELMIDFFEKAFYCRPEDFTDVKAALNVGSDFGKREIVEAVYGYWMRKRKKKRSALLKVFQLNKRPLLLPKTPTRKKRSSKRQGSKFKRSKLPISLQAEVIAANNQKAMLKVEEAKAAAENAVKEAILKRQRAQALLKNANLATYRAKMGIRIAEAAQVLGSTDAAVSHFLE